MAHIHSSHRKYTRVINAALRQPWCVTPEMAAVIQDLLVFRARGGRLTAEEIRARIGDDEDDSSPRRQARTLRSGTQGGAISVVPIYGVIADRTFDASSGMTSVEGITQMYRRALADPETDTVLLDIHSPGGGAPGVPELAAEIAQGKGRGTKRVVAIAYDLAASAAYWLGSQADEFVVIPSGEVGSIGVFSLHEDWSGWLEKEGVKITALVAGDRKLEGSPWEPLDAEAKAHFQAQVDAVYADFIKAVARGRGVSQAKVKTEFGQGRVFMADEALKRGMVDAVETFDQLVTRLTAKRGRSSVAAAKMMTSAQVAEVFGLPVDMVTSDEPVDPAAVAAPSQACSGAAEADPDDLELISAGMRMELELDDQR